MLFASPDEDPYSKEWKLVRYTTETGLPSNNTFNLIQTTNGILWAGTSEGLAWFDGYEWIKVDVMDSNVISLPHISSDLNSGIYALINGRIYRGNQNGFQLLHINNVKQYFPYSKDSIIITFTNSHSIYNLTSNQLLPLPKVLLNQDKTLGVRVTPSNRKYIFSEGWFCVIESDTLRKLIQANTYHDIDENKNGHGIISVHSPYENVGLWEWDNMLIAKRQPFPNNPIIKKVAISNNDEIMIYLPSGFFYIRRDNKWIQLPFLTSKIKNVESIDYWGDTDILINTGDGIYLYRQSNNLWSDYPGSNEPHDIIHEILLTSKGDLWLGTFNGIRIIKSNGRQENIRKIDGKFPLRSITGLAEDNEGNIWISSGEAFPGTYRWNGVSWKYFTIDNDPDTRIHRIIKDRSGMLWFLGISNKYLIEEPGAFRYSQGKFTHWSTNEGLIHNRVYSFVEGLDSSYWFATWGGISRWKNGYWKHWTTTSHNKLICNTIFTITVSKENTIWFGDRMYGLGHIDSMGKVSYMSTNNGLLNDGVLDLKYDSTGKLWISTKRGLNCHYNGIMLQFGTKTGLPTQSIWPILPTKDKVYIGTDGSGLAILNLKEKIFPPRVVLDKPIIENNSALLKWKTFSFLGQQPNDDIQVRYRIIGDDWSNWSTKREISLNKLESGSYTFEVQSIDLFGNIVESTVRTSFIIPLPLVKRPEFIYPILFLSIATILSFVNQIHRKRLHLKSIQQSEAKFRRLTQATFEGIIIFQDGIIIEANPNIQNILGYKSEDLIGHPVSSFLSDEILSKIFIFEKQYNEGLIEAALIKKDNTKILAEILFKTLSTEKGKLEVLTIRDITKRKETEQQLLSYQEQLRSLASQLVKMEQIDRRRIATYLHDDIGQALALCKIKLGEIQKNKPIDNIEEVRQLIEDTLVRTQSLTFELSPPILYELGLPDAVEWLIEEMQKKHNIKFHLESDSNETQLSDDIKVMLYHGIRELLINVIKHAKANNVYVTIKYKENKIIIDVKDDGIGFNYPVLARSDNKKGTFGLFNIRERLLQLGGDMQIDSKPGKGTSIILTAPINLINNTISGSII